MRVEYSEWMLLEPICSYFRLSLRSYKIEFKADIKSLWWVFQTEITQYINNYACSVLTQMRSMFLQISCKLGSAVIPIISKKKVILN